MPHRRMHHRRRKVGSKRIMKLCNNIKGKIDSYSCSQLYVSTVDGYTGVTIATTAADAAGTGYDVNLRIDVAALLAACPDVIRLCNEYSFATPRDFTLEVIPYGNEATVPMGIASMTIQRGPVQLVYSNISAAITDYITCLKGNDLWLTGNAMNAQTKRTKWKRSIVLKQPEFGTDQILTPAAGEFGFLYFFQKNAYTKPYAYAGAYNVKLYQVRVTSKWYFWQRQDKIGSTPGLDFVIQTAGTLPSQNIVQPLVTNFNLDPDGVQRKFAHYKAPHQMMDIEEEKVDHPGRYNINDLAEGKKTAYKLNANQEVKGFNNNAQKAPWKPHGQEGYGRAIGNDNNQFGNLYRNPKGFKDGREAVNEKVSDQRKSEREEAHRRRRTNWGVLGAPFNLGGA